MQTSAGQASLRKLHQLPAIKEGCETLLQLSGTPQLCTLTGLWENNSRCSLTCMKTGFSSHAAAFERLMSCYWSLTENAIFFLQEDYTSNSKKRISPITSTRYCRARIQHYILLGSHVNLTMDVNEAMCKELGKSTAITCQYLEMPGLSEMPFSFKDT